VDNGIYVVDTGSWTRDIDFDGTRDVVTGTIVTVTSGSVNANTGWRVSTTGSIIVGTSAISFASATFSDASTVNYTPAGTGAVTTTVQTKLRETISVVDKGAVANGSTSCLTAFTNAYNAAQAGQTILIPASSSTYAGVNGLLTGSKFVIWEAQGQPTTGATWSLPGVINEGFTTRVMFNKEQTTGADYSVLNVRRITNHTGGTPGFVNSTLRVDTVVTDAGVTDFEWAITSVINNHANAGQNVAIYGQGNKYSTGPTWAGVFEAADYYTTVDTAGNGATLGLEIDVKANGTDLGLQRFGIDLISF